MRPVLEALRPLFAFSVLMGISLFWAYKSPSNILEIDPRPVYLLTGTIFSNMSVSNMSLSSIST